LQAGVAVGDALELAGLAAFDAGVPAMDGDALLALAALEAELGLAAGAAGRWRAALRSELVAAGARALGLHLGGRLELAAGAARIDATLGVHAGTEGYVPGWIGPLYELERGRLLGASRAGGLAGLGGAAVLAVALDGFGELMASGWTRPGLGSVGMARLAAPYREGIQVAGWAAAAGDLAALAVEVRAELPAGVFATFETARLYRDAGAGLAPMWTALVAFGSSLGFGD
jgi:hypothetical protein